MANFPNNYESAGTGAGIPAGHTGRWNYAAGEWSRVSDGGGISVRQVETSLSRSAVSVDAVDADANRANCNVLARFKSTVGTGSTLRGGVVCRGSGSAGSETGYTLGIFGSELRIGRYKAGASVEMGVTAGLGLSEVVIDYAWFRLDVQGTGATVTLRGKVWAGLESDEPPSWNVTATDSSADRITANGWAGMFGFADGTKHWSDLAIATNGDTARMTSSASGPVGNATSTETASARTGVARRSTASASETSSAAALAGVARRATLAATASETAQALLSRSSLGVATSAEADAAEALASRAVRAASAASSTEGAVARAARTIGVIGVAATVEVALALSPAAPRTYATETNTAHALAGVVRAPVLAASESSAAAAPASRSLRPVEAATETSAAARLSAVLRAPVRSAVETSVARALSGNGPEPLPVVGPASQSFAAVPVITAFHASGIVSKFSASMAKGVVMPEKLSPGSFHVFSIDWRYGREPYLRSGENLASVSATVNGSAADSSIDGDETLWNVAVPSDAVPGSKLLHAVSIVTDSDPPRRETRTVLHYVGTNPAKPI